MSGGERLGDAKNWQETKLWKEIEALDDPTAKAVRSTLESAQCLPKIQTILRSAGNRLTDFTVHDEEHSFRVAERMAEIIPDDVLPALSVYELALLLLSAYLHDIGMTPEHRKVDLHYYFLLTGDAQDLSSEEIGALQAFLDDEEDGIVPPLVKDSPSVNDLRKANRITIRYCRERHNDWSADWIEANLAVSTLATYRHWVDDLVSLCKSHHMDYPELASERFEARLVGSPGQTVNLRYLAAVLRIADILDIDPERTPEVVLRHRDVDPKSVVFWLKDHYVSPTIDNGKMILSARPDKAFIHKAIDMMADAIDEELNLVMRLDSERPFRISPWRHDQPHRWTLPAALERHINPRPETYEYIDGAFRPDTQKLLELLSGTELYGSALPAVRELLQNAFDAVRECIAYERLRQDSPADPALELTLGSLHKVTLAVVRDNAGTWLVCTDDGIGMTKSIIKDHLLVSGNAKRHDVLSLERRCRAAGFGLGRTGRFGIGVLSYFMLADRVQILTRRSHIAPDADQAVWRFETEGAGSFGELQRMESEHTGTEVRLHLCTEVSEGWCWNLRSYLLSVLRYLPCRFETRFIGELSEISLTPGWVHTTDEYAGNLLDSMFRKPYGSDGGPPTELLPLTMQEERSEAARVQEQVITEAKRRLRWLIDEGPLPAGMGRYRIHIPFFDLAGGKSLLFMRTRKNDDGIELGQIAKGYSYEPKGIRYQSWRGMTLDLGVMTGERDRFVVRGVRWHSPNTQLSTLGGNGVVEMDWDSDDAGKLAVSRDGLSPSASAIDAVQWVGTRIRDMLQSFAGRNTRSAFAFLNGRATGTPLRKSADLGWIAMEGCAAKWKPISFPAMNSLPWEYRRPPQAELYWNGRQVSVISCLGEPNDDDHYDGRTWNSISMSPDVVVQITGYSLSMAPLWSKHPTGRRTATHPVGHTASFPPNWEPLCGVEFTSIAKPGGGSRIWNPKHPLIRLVTDATLEWSRRTFQKNTDPLEYRDEILKRKSTASAWIICFLTDPSQYVWEGLVERDPEFLHELWCVLFGETQPKDGSSVPLCHWRQHSSDSYLRVLRPSGYTIHRDRSVIMRHLPDPGMMWRLESADTLDLPSDEHRARTANRRSKT